MKVGTDAVLLGAWADVNSSVNILDIGTGCGIIALMSAQRNPQCHVDALELNSDAAEQAKENVIHSLFASRVRVINQSLKNFNPRMRYEAILSNPPYFEGSLLSPDENRNKVRHAIEMTLSDIFSFSAQYLTDNGKINLILPFEPEKVIAAAKIFNFFPVKICEVISHAGKRPVRLLISFGRKKSEPEYSQLIMFSQNRVPTEEYRTLTKDFYLHF